MVFPMRVGELAVARRRRRGVWTLAVLLASAASAACGSNEQETQPGKACNVGDTRPCVGPGACQGGQSCIADGSGFGPCDCGTAGTGGASGDGGSSDSGSSNCPTGLPGPALVEVPAPDGSSYCIDSTEVTEAHYAEFLAAGVDIATQEPEYLSFWGGKPNTFELDFDCVAGKKVAGPMYPVVCVDYCDALEYCKWAGKRRCGKIGGGVLDEAEAFDPLKSEWVSACSAGGTTKYAYGDTQQKCGDFSDAVQVTKYPECGGGYPGLLGMSGNVSEWGGGMILGGGAPDYGGFVGECAAKSVGSAASVSRLTGFRCCATMP